MPLRQPLALGVLIVMAVAAMSPRSFALPTAVAHRPTTTAALVATTVRVTVVVEPSVTVIVVAVGDALAVADDRPSRRTPRNVTVEPDTVLTVPVANAKLRGPCVPDGAPLGLGAPLSSGAPPWLLPAEALSPPGPLVPKLPPARTVPVGQAPFTFASTRTDVAFSAVLEPVTGVPVTVTQSPVASLAVTVRVNRVVLV